METKNRDTAYEKLNQARMEANLRYIAGRIVEREEREIDDSIDTRECGELPPEDSEFHERMLKLARELDAQARQDDEAKNRERDEAVRREIHRRKIKTLERCAVVLLGVCIIGIAATTPADAWKYRFSNLFASEEDDHVVIKPFDSEILDGWSGYYIFSELPEGYALTYADDDGIEKRILFTKGENQLILGIYDANTAVYADNEYATYEKVTINGNDGYLFDSEENEYTQLIWLQGTNMLHIVSEGKERIPGAELLILAEGMQYVK